MKKNATRNLTNNNNYLLIAIIIILASSTGFLFYRMTQLNSSFKNLRELHIGLQQDYLNLYDSYTIIEEYYNESRDMYTILRNEFNTLENDYIRTLQEKRANEHEMQILLNNYTQLQANYTQLKIDYDTLLQELRNLEQIVNLERRMSLESSRVLDIQPENEILLTYEMNYAGYIQVNFTASTDIYFWIGSNITEEEYYSRHPPFPNTATEGIFTIPVVKTIYLLISNPNYEETATVNLTIKFYY